MKSHWVPEAKIVPDELWQRVKARPGPRVSPRSTSPVRPAYLHWDLVDYGVCGSNNIASGGGRSRCRQNFRKGPCEQCETSTGGGELR